MLQSKLPPCAVCGETNYIKQSGFFVCTNCDVQSQEIIDETFEYIGDNANRLLADDDRAEVTVLSEHQEEARNLTSWEAYSLILKGILQEMIQLGVPDEVRIVALQLWAQYLRKCGAAFISKYTQKPPKLTAGFKEKDVQILYGVKNLRQKIVGDHYPSRHWKRKTAGDTGSESTVSHFSSNSSKEGFVSVSELRRKQRKLAKSVLSNTDLDDTQVSETESLMTLSSKNISKKRKRVKLKFRSDAENKFSKMVSKITENQRLIMNPHSNRGGKDELRYKRNVLNCVERSKGTSPAKKESLTMTTILSIIRLSLLMLGHHIQLSDLLRWIREGRLSMTKPDSFLPTGEHLGRQPFSNIQRHGLQKNLLSTARCLSIDDIQAPNLYEIVERYCTELKLPKEFLKKVHSVMFAHPPVMTYRTNIKSNFPDYECRAISYIIFVAKLLFGLNDYSEYKYSDLASNVNRYYEENHIQKQKLFSWREWTRYIECRKAVLSKFIAVQNEKYYESRLCNEYNFINHWSRASSTDEAELCVMDEVILNSMSKIMSKFEKNKIEHKEFPITITPRVDETNHILNTMVHMVPKSAVKILRRDFSNDSILYLMDNDRCKQTFLDCGFELETTLNELSFKKYEPKETTLLPGFSACTRGKVAHRRVKIALTKTKLPSIPSELSEFKPEYEKISCNSSNQFALPENDSGKSRFPKVEYWFFHSVFRGMKKGEFEEISALFPSSFLWLLEECSTLVEIHIKDIYTELVNIEMTLYKKFVDKKYKVKGMKMHSKEW